MSFRVFAALAAAAMAAGLGACATADNQAAADYQPKVYRTGSNLPLKDGDASHGRALVVDPAALERIQTGPMPRGN